MSATDFAREPSDRKDDLRYQQARLALIVSSLPASIVFSPIMTLLAASAFLINPATFGAVSLRQIALALAAQLVNSATAWTILRRNRDRTRPPQTMQRELIGVQVVYALCWGVVCWIFWRDGNAVNNMFVALVLVSVVWSGTFARAAHVTVFLVGTLIFAVICTARFATASGPVAHVLTWVVPPWLAYILLMARSSRRRIDELLKMRFANEDLTQALRHARDDALTKRCEAEAANNFKTVFLANMSHELRTPLNAILGFSDIIAQQHFGPANPAYPEYARDIHTSGEHLLSLINDLLDVAKIEAGKMEIDPQPLNPSLALGSLERMMAHRAREKKQKLLFVVEDGAPTVVADERAFKQIALNLISNALKYTPEGGRINVRCKRGDGGGFVFAVEDNGPGIEKEKLDTVFKPFSQIDNRYDRSAGGTGLGLSLVEGLARLHNGRAWMESERNRGTKVFVYFPLVIEPSSPKFQAIG